MKEKQIDVSYFLDFLNNDCAIWCIRAVLVIAIVSVLGFYYYQHYQYRKENENEKFRCDKIHNVPPIASQGGKP